MSESTPASAGVKSQNKSPQQKLKPDDIRYLVLEGGGGKGFAYLGAISVLEKIKTSTGRTILQNIEGFGGASAGAITAFLLSMGYKSIELDDFMKEDFTKFFDPAVPRRKPEPFGDYSPVEQDSPTESDVILGRIPVDPKGVVANLIANHLGAANLATSVLATVIDQIAFEIAGVLDNKEPFLKLAMDWRHYLAYLPNDMGLFSGEAARRKFDSIVCDRAAKQDGGLPSSYRGLSFERHSDIFGKRLLLTGTNLSSGKTQLFSKEATPDFPVADAVRISMGLPWIYKPYVIADGGDRWPQSGTYVDGGVWNNLPYREFDGEHSAEKKPASAATARTRPPKRATLGLRVEIDTAAKVDSIWALSWQMIQHSLFGSGESQVLDKYLDQMILLDTCGLGLIDFKPDPVTRLRVIRRAKREVWRYFDMGFLIPPEDINAADDLATEGRRYRGEACGD